MRGSEVLEGVHEHYSVLPAAFYREVIDRTGLRPVFFGQIEENSYIETLKQTFPQAEFIAGSGAIHDFPTLRNSVNIVVSISTFSWLAAYLSHARRVILPLYGLFNPNQARDHFFVPEHEETYEFYGFPISHAINVFRHPDKFNRNQNLLARNFRLLGKSQVRAMIEGRHRFPRTLSDFLGFSKRNFTSMNTPT